MSSIDLIFASTVAVVAVFVNPAFSDEIENQSQKPSYTFSSGVDFTTGKFGDPENSRYITLPQIASVTYGRWLTEWTIPYVIASGPNNVVPGVGVNVFEEDPLIAAQKSTRTGLGDITGLLSYQVYGKTEEIHANLIGKVKFGTASTMRGLGTGKNDYASAVGITEPFEDFIFSESVGYSVNGSPAGSKLKNTLFWQVTANYAIQSQTNVGLTMNCEDGVLPSAPGGGSTQVLTAYLTQEITDDWKVQVDSSKGFSPSSINYGAGVALIHSF